MEAAGLDVLPDATLVARFTRKTVATMLTGSRIIVVVTGDIASNTPIRPRSVNIIIINGQLIESFEIRWETIKNHERKNVWTRQQRCLKSHPLSFYLLPILVR